MMASEESLKNIKNQLENPPSKKRYRVNKVRVFTSAVLVAVALGAAGWVVNNPDKALNAGKIVIQKGEKFLDSTLGRAIDYEYEKVEKQKPHFDGLTQEQIDAGGLHKNPEESSSKGK